MKRSIDQMYTGKKNSKLQKFDRIQWLNRRIEKDSDEVEGLRAGMDRDERSIRKLAELAEQETALAGEVAELEERAAGLGKRSEEYLPVSTQLMVAQDRLEDVRFKARAVYYGR
jgi:transcription initiation factor IIF auxiliary subunit